MRCSTVISPSRSNSSARKIHLAMMRRSRFARPCFGFGG
jgi:hypothetical protein